MMEKNQINNDVIINIPSSKSYAQRIIICAALCCKNKPILLHNVNMCNDVKSCINAMQSLGANIEYLGFGNVKISKSIDISNEHIIRHLNIGESGTTCRILIPILASLENHFYISGEGSIMKRDMSSCSEILNQNPVYYKLHNKYLPINLFGYLDDNKFYKLDGSATSQYISGLIIAYAYHNMSCHIIVNNCSSYGYVKITIEVLKMFGITNIIEHYCNDGIIDIEIVHNIAVLMEAPKEEITVENDWSSFGAIYLASSLIGNPQKNIVISGNGMNRASQQPDCDILYKGWQMFENVKVNPDESIIINHIDEVKPFTIDISNTPDLFPYYAGFASISKDYCEIKGLHKLVNKESNRGQVIFEEFTKLGIDCKIIDDSIFIKKGKELLDKPYNSHNDHRIGQTLAIIKLINNGHIKYLDDCLNKSYPDFINDIEKIYEKRIRTFI